MLSSTYQSANSGIVVDKAIEAVSGALANGGIATKNDLYHVIPTTYADLVALKTAGNLEPGKWYRITDYQCTTLQENTRALNHQFDILVLALQNDTLSEDAYADHHEGDEYFANCEMQNWQLKYRLENDSHHFLWADPENGKGVIYRMIDEFQNTCGYDFKNIQFKRWKVTGVQGTTFEDQFLYENDGNQNYDAHIAYDSVLPQKIGANKALTIDANDSIWCYTFSRLDGQEMIDLSLPSTWQPSGWGKPGFNFDGYWEKNTAYNNVIQTYIMTQLIDGYPRLTHALNNIVFFAYDGPVSDTESPCRIFSNMIEWGCYNMSFGRKTYFNTFAQGTHDFIVGSNFYNNEVGTQDASWTIALGCSNNVIEGKIEGMTMWREVQNCHVTAGLMNLVIPADSHEINFMSKKYKVETLGN